MSLQHLTVSNVYTYCRLIDIQSRIFDLGVAVATPLDSKSETKKAIAEVRDMLPTLQLPLMLVVWL
jgi:hypothetical protein